MFLGLYIESVVFLGLFIESVVFLGLHIESVVFLGLLYRVSGVFRFEGRFSAEQRDELRDGARRSMRSLSECSRRGCRRFKSKTSRPECVNILRAPQKCLKQASERPKVCYTLLKGPQSVSNTPRGRDV